MRLRRFVTGAEVTRFVTEGKPYRGKTLVSETRRWQRDGRQSRPERATVYVVAGRLGIGAINQRFPGEELAYWPSWQTVMPDRPPVNNGAMSCFIHFQ
jgi:hypothetical protein